MSQIYPSRPCAAHKRLVLSSYACSYTKTLMLLFEQIVLGGKGNKLLNNLTAEVHLKLGCWQSLYHNKSRSKSSQVPQTTLGMSIQLGTPTRATACFMFTNFEKGFLLYHAYKTICVNTKSTAFIKQIDSDICAKCLQLCFGSESKE